MSAGKHTPGPWSVSELSASGHFSEDYIFIEPGIAVIERAVEGQDAEDMPNAHLIAAAPELLEALQAARLHIVGEALPTKANAIAMIKAAIAKATGEATP